LSTFWLADQNALFMNIKLRFQICSRLCFTHLIQRRLFSQWIKLLFKVLKKRYKKELLWKTVLSEADADYRVSQLKNINLKDCCYMIAPAWNSILGSTFHVSWKKILAFLKRGFAKYCHKCKLSEDKSRHFAHYQRCGTLEQIIEIYKNSELSLDEVEHDNEIFETAEKDENKDVDASDEPNKGLCHSKTHSGLKVSLK
ncbi:hypothetical protein T12_11357, partial [Trichinella patagoniensis]